MTFEANISESCTAGLDARGTTGGLGAGADTGPKALCPVSPSTPVVVSFRIQGGLGYAGRFCNEYRGAQGAPGSESTGS